MASKIAGKIRKVNTLVNADLSSDDSDDECDKGKRHSHAKKKDILIKGNKNKNNNQNAVRFDERAKNEKPTEKKDDGKCQGYFVPQLTNSYYPSQPVNNSEYVYCNYPNQGASVRSAAPVWNGNHFENVPLPRPNPHQPKYYSDFIINNPNLSEIPHRYTLENLPSAHHVAKDNDLSRYYSVLELPRSQKNHVTFSPEPLKENRYYYDKPHPVNFPTSYLVRNKQQTYKAPPMEVPYENPNGQFRYERGVNKGFANVGPPSFGNQNRLAVQPNMGNVTPVVNNFPDQFNGRNPLINRNPQGMKSAYSVYTPGNLNSQSLNNVYIPPTTMNPVRMQAARGVFSGNDHGRSPTPVTDLPPQENPSMGNNINGRNENPMILRNCPNGWQEKIPNESNFSCNNSQPKNPSDEKPMNLSPRALLCPKSNCSGSQGGEGLYEGNNISMNKPQNKNYPNRPSDCNSAKTVPNFATMPEGWNNNPSIDPVKRMLEVLKMTLENPPRPKQNAEVQNDLPEIAREDKTTHTQYKVEDKETQYKPISGKDGSQDFKEIGTQVRYFEQKRDTRKCQGVTALHSHFRSKSPCDWKQSETNHFKTNTKSGDSKYYINLGEIKDTSILEKKNKAYQEIADIIKRENGKDNQEMADVIFNMIYGKNCHIVVQKGVNDGEGKKNALHKNVKKNQGISTTNLGSKNQKPSWKDVWASPRNKGKDQVTSPLNKLLEHVVFPKNDMQAIRDNVREKDTTKPGINPEEKYFFKKQSDPLNKALSGNCATSKNFENNFANASNKNNAKIKFVPPTLITNENGNTDEKEEIVVDIENEKILQCLLNNDNLPKGEIIIDVGCVQVPDESGICKTEDNLNLKENLRVEESGKLSQYMSRTELYEEAILNLIAKQIKKCTSEWKFDVKDDEDDEAEESKRGPPNSQIIGKKCCKPNSEGSIGEKKRMFTTTFRSENNVNIFNANFTNQEENSDCAKPIDGKTENGLNTGENQELNEFYESIKYLFGMLDDGEKYEFISDVMKKITNFYANESNSSSPQSPKDRSYDVSDNKQGTASEEENALAQILRMICYENNMANVDGLLPYQFAKTKENDVGERTNSTNSDDPSSAGFSIRDEIVSNYVLLDTPGMVINMGNRFVNKLKDKYQIQLEPKTVSRGVSANL